VRPTIPIRADCARRARRSRTGGRCGRSAPHGIDERGVRVLFKLLADPGDAVLTATPSYPLLEHLASLELVELRTFAMEFHRRWEIHDVPVDARTRAIVVNPTTRPDRS
jgi:hypothetical protein